jgi:hypothetical protein
MANPDTTTGAAADVEPIAIPDSSPDPGVDPVATANLIAPHIVGIPLF